MEGCTIHPSLRKHLNGYGNAMHGYPYSILPKPVLVPHIASLEATGLRRSLN